ncbi:hypothetical protein SVIO_069880 [Streptomyces violaceusniger]|uniref:Suppressor of fused-like domain-containing protein n=1 Tax=Streptomyces violaceusniger TaxID=68280 RepID=A0A4D4L5K0_STRVO|nr:hypothetical protein SVIO_069880 [Streptomyces violaceusniger]
MSDVLQLVEARLITALGEPDARAAVTFVGTDRIEVLRFRDESDVIRYATLGMSDHPMTSPTAAVADPLRGPRAELVLTVRAGGSGPDLSVLDEVLRPLAVLAASPQVEGVVVTPARRWTSAGRCGRGRLSPPSWSPNRAAWSRTWSCWSPWSRCGSCRCCR